jgi:hypothetical protein
MFHLEFSLLIDAESMAFPSAIPIPTFLRVQARRSASRDDDSSRVDEVSSRFFAFRVPGMPDLDLR